MIFVVLALAAGTVVMPAPVRRGQFWLGPDDYPAGEFQAGHNGSVYYKVVVGPAGKADSCIIERATLSQSDKTAFCATVMSRFRYKDVVGPDGSPTYFVQEENFLYVLPDGGSGTPMRSGPDFSFDVQSLPKAMNGKVEVRVNVAVDDKGGLVKCDAPADATYAALAQLACSQLPPLWQTMPEKNAAGQPVAYIRQMRVEFRQAASAN